jgi:hypothetical protein
MIFGGTNPLSGRKRRGAEEVCSVCVLPSLNGVLGRIVQPLSFPKHTYLNSC